MQDINFNLNFHNRGKKINFFDTSKFKQGKNLMANRFTVINDQIECQWLSLHFMEFKTYQKTIPVQFN